MQKTALETLGRLQEPVLEETERALQKAIRLYPQNAEAHYILGYEHQLGVDPTVVSPAANLRQEHTFLIPNTKA